MALNYNNITLEVDITRDDWFEVQGKRDYPQFAANNVHMLTVLSTET